MLKFSFPGRKDFKLLLIVIAVLAACALAFFPAEHWLPFSDDFPEWMVQTPAVVLLEQMLPFFLVAVVIWGLVLLAKRGV